MIVHTPANTPRAIQLLENAKTSFYLTGSRFFGNATAESDWDYYAQYSQEAIAELTLAGFRSIKNETPNYKGDPLIVDIYERIELAGVVQVQLVTNVTRKTGVQAFLKARFPKGLPGTKEDKKVLWTMAYTLTTTRALV